MSDRLLEFVADILAAAIPTLVITIIAFAIVLPVSCAVKSASAMSAGTAATTKIGAGLQPASAVPERQTPTTEGDS